ncbi:MAG: bifunctional metallophosphatase/5'-nucleotidase [Candidatus Bipolaricaulia bacterium]
MAYYSKKAGKFWVMILLALSALSVNAYAVELVFLHTNDLHLSFGPRSEDGIGGTMVLEQLIQEIRAQHEHVLLVDSGDTWQDFFSPRWSLLKGEPMVTWMNRVGYDAMALGNHEFLYGGLDRIRKNVNQAAFPVLSANLRSFDPRRFPVPVAPYIVRELGGLNVLIIGLTTQEFVVAQIMHPYRLNDPSWAVREVLDQVDEAIDLVVVVAHIRETKAAQIIAENPEIDLFFSGHTHLALEDPIQVGTAYVFQSGWWARFLGMVRVTVDPITKAIVNVENTLIPAVNDPETLEASQRFSDQFQGEIDRRGLKAAITLGVLLLPLLWF